MEQDTIYITEPDMQKALEMIIQIYNVLVVENKKQKNKALLGEARKLLGIPAKPRTKTELLLKESKAILQNNEKQR